MVILRCAVSPERNVRGVTTVSAFDSITATRWFACDFQGSTATLRNRSIALAGSPFSTSKIEATANWACDGGFGAGELADQGLPRGDRLVELLLAGRSSRRLEEDLRDPAVERVLGDEGLPGGAGLGIILAARGVRRRSEVACPESPAGRLPIAGHWDIWPRNLYKR